MCPPKPATTITEMYDQALKYSRDNQIPAGTPQPVYTKDWLPENIATLERYYEWLSTGGTSPYVTRIIHLPMAGHILGINLKPSIELDLDLDLEKGMDYIHAKQHGPFWTKNCRNSLRKFRRFLLNERGQVESHITLYDPTPDTTDLPEWLIEQLNRLLRVQQRNWREARLDTSIRRFWSGHLRLWRFLCNQYHVSGLDDLKRSYFLDYIDSLLTTKLSVRTINANLRSFHGFMAFLQEQGWSVPQFLFRIPCLKQPDALPKFIPDQQVRALRDEFEQQVLQGGNSARMRNALLDRACFYLLWQSALRLGEVEDLRMQDLDLASARLTVRRGKGMVDRTVYLTPSVLRALEAYLAVRGIGPTDHVFLYRNQPICKDLIHSRLKGCGIKVGVKVNPHRLRHTCATQLLNAGCRITTIQRFLGHKRLDTTLVYARVHDQTVADDYFSAMNSVEQRLDLIDKMNEPVPLTGVPRAELLALVDQLAVPDLGNDIRLDLVNQMRTLLCAGIPEQPP
jgi:integrase